MNRSNQLPNLDKLLRDDDDQDFAPQGGSNLAALFAPQRSDSAHTGKPSPGPLHPPPALTTPAPPPAKTEVIIAKVVHAYKLENSQYTLIGKLGIALAGSASSQTYLLILYKAKQEYISVATLTPDFLFSPREFNYATYYDKKNDNWSILFDTADAATDFAREVGLAKYFLRASKSEEIFSQDLTVQKQSDTEARKAEENDEVELSYLLVPTITQPLKLTTPKQTMKIRISPDDTWERSLLGVQKSLKRLLVLPPSKQLSLGPGYPREQDIVMLLEVLDIAKPEPKKHPKQSLAPGKASLISRMAKMGQSMLPKLPTSTTDSEDTDDEVQVKSRRLRSQSDQSRASSNGRSIATALPAVESHPPAPINHQINSSVLPNFAWNVQQYRPIDGQLYTYQSPVIPPVDPNLNVFLSESRTHNAEIRMGMSKISDNVQKLLDKLHAMELERYSDRSPVHDRSLENSLKALLLRDNVTPKDVDAGRSDNELVLRSRVKALEDSLQLSEKALAESLSSLEKCEGGRRTAEGGRSELEEEVRRLQTSLADCQRDLRQSLIDNALLEDKLGNAEADRRALEKNVSLSLGRDGDKSGQVKQIMNKTYQALVGKFTEEVYGTDYIKTVLAETIRSVTLQVLQEKKSGGRGAEPEGKADFGGEGRVEDTGMLTCGDRTSDKTIDTSILSEEPPPIPPMDLDIDNDWLA